MTDTLIETVRIIDGRAPLWPLHRWRIMNSALMLGVPLPDVEAPHGGADRVVRIEIGDGQVAITERDVDDLEAHLAGEFARAASRLPPQDRRSGVARSRPHDRPGHRRR